MFLDDLAASASLKFTRMQFGAKRRIRLYTQLSMMLENRIMLIDALREMYLVASHDGRKPNNCEATVINSCYTSVSEGNSLSEGLRPWTNAYEAAVISSGERAGDVRGAFGDAIAMIEARQRIKQAVMGAAAYPVVLLGMLCFLLNIVANDLIPKLSAVSDPNAWTGPAHILYLIANFVTNWGKLALLGLFGAIVAIAVSLPRLCGKVRVRLDDLAPWSIYRVIHGSIFLLNIAMLIRSGVLLKDALQITWKNAGSAWLKERVHLVMDRLSAGAGFGDALSETGTNFPDKEAIRYLRLLSKLQGFDKVMAAFARQWLESTIEKVKTIARGFLVVSILLMGGTLGLVVISMSDIENAIQTSASSY